MRRQNSYVVPASGTERIEFLGQSIGLDQQSGIVFAKQLPQLCVGGHRFNDLLEVGPDHRLSIHDKQQDWPFPLRYFASRVVIPDPPKYALVGKMG